MNDEGLGTLRQACRAGAATAENTIPLLPRTALHMPARHEGKQPPVGQPDSVAQHRTTQHIRA